MARYQLTVSFQNPLFPCMFLWLVAVSLLIANRDIYIFYLFTLLRECFICICTSSKLRCIRLWGCAGSLWWIYKLQAGIFCVLFLESVLCHAYIKIQIYQDRKWHVIVPKARKNPAVPPSPILALEEFLTLVLLVLIHSVAQNVEQI